MLSKKEKISSAVEIINQRTKIRIVDVRYHGDIDIDFVVTEPFYMIVESVVYGILHTPEEELAYQILDVIMTAYVNRIYGDLSLGDSLKVNIERGKS